MRIRSLILSCAALLPAAAQEAYFKEEAPNPWIPQWELTATAERQNIPPGGVPDFDRERSKLKLQWSFGSEDGIQLKVGTASYLGSDGNAKNLSRLDNEPSNGSRLDLAELHWNHFSERLGVEAEGGLVENPMITSETLWDPNLRIVGGGGRAFLRGEEALEELGVRGVAGEVRLQDGGRVRIRAGQAVLRLLTGSFTWTAHAGLWDLTPRQEDAPFFLRQNGGAGLGPNGYYGNYGVYGNTGGYAEPEYRYTSGGLQVDWDGAVPVSVSANRQKRQEDGDTGQDFQVWIGSPSRRWWPQAGFIHQIIDPDGALGSINGDQWWFHSNASGNRYVLALNLPKRWRVSLEYVSQTRTNGAVASTRSDLVIQKRF